MLRVDLETAQEFAYLLTSGGKAAGGSGEMPAAKPRRGKVQLGEVVMGTSKLVRKEPPLSRSIFTRIALARHRTPIGPVNAVVNPDGYAETPSNERAIGCPSVVQSLVRLELH